MPYERRYYRIEADGRLTPLGGEHPTAVRSAAVLAQEKEAWVHQTFERISGQYDLMNDLESFGLHRAWKRHLVKAVSALAPQRVLDVASGTGDIALALAEALPEAQVIGFDFSENMLEVARRRAEKAAGDAARRRSGRAEGVAPAAPAAPPADAPPAAPPDAPSTAVPPSTSTGDNTNLRFVRGNALEMPFEDGSFDVVTISFGLRNMADYQRVCEEMVRVLKPGGTLLCLEASYPTAPLVKPLFRLYFRHLMPAMATLVTRKPAEYRWLNDSTEAFLSKPQLVYLLQSCGLSDVRYRSFAAGAAALHTGVK